MMFESKTSNVPIYSAIGISVQELFINSSLKGRYTEMCCIRLISA